MSEPDVVTVRGLRKAYGSRVVVDDVDLDVHAGEIVALIGANGAGKTTTVECIQGLGRPDAGDELLERFGLVERFRSAGADVTLAADGSTDGLPATTGLAVHRILQEALTNAVKHAPGAPSAASLTVRADAVEFAVDSAGEPGCGTGLGLLSMRERAELLGGSCKAGPGGRGWLVRGTLPLDPTTRRETAR